MKTTRPRFFAGFTLIELMLATAAAAVIMMAIYGVFSKAVRLRDAATERTRDSRLRARAAEVITRDLQNALVSGGKMAAILVGSRESRGGGFPGYLKFTTTTARGADEELIVGDVQQVEYYVTTDPDNAGGKSGLLVRAVDPNLLAPVRTEVTGDTLLAGVESMEVSFYDGSSWQETWEVTDTAKTLPTAVRVRIQPAAVKTGAQLPPPIEVLVPWNAQPAIEEEEAASAAAPAP